MKYVLAGIALVVVVLVVALGSLAGLTSRGEAVEPTLDELTTEEFLARMGRPDLSSEGCPVSGIQQDGWRAGAYFSGEDADPESEEFYARARITIVCVPAAPAAPAQ